MHLTNYAINKNNENFMYYSFKLISFNEDV